MNPFKGAGLGNGLREVVHVGLQGGSSGTPDLPTQYRRIIGRPRGSWRWTHPSRVRRGVRNGRRLRVLAAEAR